MFRAAHGDRLPLPPRLAALPSPRAWKCRSSAEPRILRLAEGFETFSQAAEKQALLEAELSKLRAELAQAKEQIVNQGTALVAMEVDRDQAATASEEKLAALKRLQQLE